MTCGSPHISARSQTLHVLPFFYPQTRSFCHLSSPCTWQLRFPSFSSQKARSGPSCLHDGRLIVSQLSWLHRADTQVPPALFPHHPAPAPTTSYRGFRPSLSIWSLQSHLTRPPSASSLSRSPVPHTLPRLSSHSDGQSEVPQSEVRCPPSLATSFPLPLSAPSPAATLAPRALLRRPTLAYGRLPQASLTPLTLLPRHHPSIGQTFPDGV